MNFHPIARYMDSLLDKGVPGCDVIITQDHRELYRYSCGYADAERTAPVSPRDMYFMYSCTKPITVAAAMQLVEAGQVGLDDPVANSLPAFAHLQVLQGGEAIPAQKTMRVRHLFTMSAGLDYDLGAEPVRQVLQETGGRATTRQIVDALAQKPLLFEPGDRFEYSLCHDVLAALIEAVAGMSFGAYLRQHIFEPLGMRDACLRMTPEIAPRMAAQYAYDAESKTLEQVERSGFAISEGYESGGGGLISTLGDYARFADAMACGGVSASGKRILRAETVDLIRTEQLSHLVRDPSFGCAAGPGYGYGLGVRTLVDRSQGQRSPLGEFGWDGAAGAYIMMDRDHALSIVYAQHIRNWPAMLGCVHAPIRDMTYEILGL